MRLASERLAALFVACAALGGAACSSDAGAGVAAPSGWTIVRDDLDRVPLCVFGASPADVWLGGGGLASGRGALLMHDTGAGPVEVATGEPDTIWWLHGASASAIWAVGEHGMALFFDGATWKRVATGTDATLYGVFAAAEDDAWAVGGSPTSAGENDVLLHFDGRTWTRVAAPRALGATYFKIWGSGPRTIWTVGTGGLALHWDGASWREVETSVHTTLFTVTGRGDSVVAVGGSPPALVRWNGASFEPAPLPPYASGILSGVALDASGTTFVVGEHGQRLRIDAAGVFHDDGDAPAIGADLHAVFADGAGGAVAVGGNYLGLTSPTSVPRGVVARYAPRAP